MMKIWNRWSLPCGEILLGRGFFVNADPAADKVDNFIFQGLHNGRSPFVGESTKRGISIDCQLSEKTYRLTRI